MSWVLEDIEERFRSDFGADLEIARQKLERLHGIATDDALPRIARCVVHLADGDLEKLIHFVECARQDWRDVIWWTEYAGGERQVRDFHDRFR
jgi:hypothetical protein